MAIAMLFEFRNMDGDTYDRFISETYGGEPMPGVISHAAGPLDDGGWWAFDVYESQEAADRIASPAIERLGQMGVEVSPAVRTFQVHNFQGS